jgi:hypothetical protein
MYSFTLALKGKQRYTRKYKILRLMAIEEGIVENYFVFKFEIYLL